METFITKINYLLFIRKRRKLKGADNKPILHTCIEEALKESVKDFANFN